MKIYTKTGDKGESSLFGGKRIPKDATRLESYGTVDELNSIVGICRSMNTVKALDQMLETIQNDLFVLGADLATPQRTASKHFKRITQKEIKWAEASIDKIEGEVEPLKNFILPGGNRSAAMLHFARTVCRRAERLVVRLAREEEIGDVAIIYLNRLSDLFFMLARWANALSNTPEVKWKA